MRVFPGVEAVNSTASKFEAERAELDSLLSSEAFGRVHNLAKVLSFVCEKYFQGCTDEVKEYDIAVHALGRPKDFDPQIDTIVRVTAHTLRKRLEQYYRTEGREHAVHIYLPAGRYVPKFVRNSERAAEILRLASKDGTESVENGAAHSVSPSLAVAHRAPLLDEPAASALESSNGKRTAPETKPTVEVTNRFRIWAALGLAVVLLCAFAAAAWYVRLHSRNASIRTQAQTSVTPPGTVSLNTVRAQVGDGRTPFVDRAGQTWSGDTACTGGSSFTVPARTIHGTFDSELFFAGRAGLFHCAFPVPPGTYEVHLLFAETTSVEETGRIVAYSLNGGPSTGLDVVDDAGGNDTETEKVFVGVHPEADGKIHLDFTSTQSYLNAIEILPGAPNKMLPVRIHAGETVYVDSEGNRWLPNRYNFGGRESHYQVVDAAAIPDGGLFASQWIGHFHYVIPVALGEKYTVKLHFRESYFGGQDGGGGVVGSRVFDVWCNGEVILKHFDIIQDAGSAPITKTFFHVEPTAQGKIELYFVPVVNYPSLNAIEVVAE